MLDGTAAPNQSVWKVVVELLAFRSLELTIVRCVHMTFFIVGEFAPRNQPTDRCKRISVHLVHEDHDRPVTSDSPCSKNTFFQKY